MTNPISDAFINALLADACYVDGLRENLEGDAFIQRLQDRMTPDLAKLISDNFVVKSQASGYTSSFEATVWEGAPGSPYAGKTYLSMRGAKEPNDFNQDGVLAGEGMPVT